MIDRDNAIAFRIGGNANTQTNSTVPSHAKALQYVATNLYPDVIGGKVPDPLLVPVVPKTIVIDAVRDTPGTDMRIIPMLHTNKPCIEIQYLGKNGTVATPVNIFLTKDSETVYPDQDVASSYNQIRLVSGVTSVTSGVKVAANTDLKGSITAGMVHGLPPNMSTDVVKLTSLVVNDLTQSDILNGVSLIQPPQSRFMTETKAINANSIDSTPRQYGLIGDSSRRETRTYHATSVSYDAGTGHYVGPAGQPPIGPPMFLDMRSQTFPISLSRRLRLKARWVMDMNGSSSTVTTATLNGYFADVDSTGLVTVAIHPLLQIGSQVGNSNSAMYGEVNLDLSYSTLPMAGAGQPTIRPPGRLVGFDVETANTGISAGFYEDGVFTLEIEDLAPYEVDESNVVAELKSFTSGQPLRFTGLANLEAVPDFTLRQQLQPQAEFVGSQYYEAALEALMGPHGVFRGTLPASEYHVNKERFLRGQMDRETGTAYAMSFGPAWELLKPGLRAMVPGAANLIAGVAGERFRKPLEELGNVAFSSTRIAYAADDEETTAKTEVEMDLTPTSVHVKCACPCNVMSDFEWGSKTLPQEGVLGELGENPNQPDQIPQEQLDSDAWKNMLYRVFHAMSTTPLPDNTEEPPRIAYAMDPDYIRVEQRRTGRNQIVPREPETNPFADDDELDQLMQLPAQSAAAMEETERAARNFAENQQFTRGSTAAANFRQLASQSKQGNTTEMYQHLNKYGATVPTVLIMGTEPDAPATYSVVTCSFRPNSDGQNSYERHDLAIRPGAQSAPTLMVGSKLDAAVVAPLAQSLYANGMIHPVWVAGRVANQGSVLYLDQYAPAYIESIRGRSNELAIAATLMGCSGDVVASARVEFGPDGPTIHTPGRIIDKYLFTSANGLKLITGAGSDKFSGKLTQAFQGDFDRGFRDVVRSDNPFATESEGAVGDLFSGVDLFGLSRLGTAIHVMTRPQMIRGAAPLAEGAEPVKTKKDVIAESGSVSVEVQFDEQIYNFDIENQKSVDEMVEKLSRSSAHAAKVLKMFKPVINNVLGQVQVNAEGRAVKQGEKGVDTELRLKPAFQNSLDRLSEQVEATRIAGTKQIGRASCRERV